MVYDIRKDAVQETVDSFHLTDLSLWGEGGNPARNLRALTLFVTKTDKDGARTLLTVTKNTSDPMTVSAWDVAISLDGLVEKILFVVQLYGSGVNYVTDDIFFYDSNNKYYKAKQDSVGQTPTDTTYFQEVAEEDLYDEVLNDSTTMEVDITYDLITGRTDLEVVEARQEDSDTFQNGKYTLEYTKADYLWAILNSAESARTNNRPLEAEEIIRGIENYLLTY